MLWGGLGRLISTYAMNKSRCDFGVEAEVMSSAPGKRKEKLIHLPFHLSHQCHEEDGQAGETCWEGQLVTPYSSPRKEAELLILSVFNVFMWH